MQGQFDIQMIAAVAGVVGALVSVVGLAVTLVRHMLRYAYDKGVTDNRLDTLEKAHDGLGAMQGLITGIQATMAAINQSILRLDRAVEHLTQRVFEGREP